MSRRILIAGLVALGLVSAPAGARAATYAITFEPAAPMVGEQVAFHAGPTNPGEGGGDVFNWDFGDGTTGSGQDAPHAYAAPGAYTVTLIVTDSQGSSTVGDTAEIVVTAPNAAPSVAFTFTPAAPMAGEGVSFVPSVSDPDGDAITMAWDFGDGATSSEPAPVHSYAAAGSYPVTLTATDARGAAGFSSRTIAVGGAPAPTREAPSSTHGTTTPGALGTPVSLKPKAKRLLRMKPFPVVRIAGVILPRGALVKILSVRAPRGSQVRVRCRGRGCPVGSVSRTNATRLIRFGRFERRLRAGVTLELFVRQPGRIGKYTRFGIRAGEPPARVDRCLVPGRRRPTGCG